LDPREASMSGHVKWMAAGVVLLSLAGPAAGENPDGRVARMSFSECLNLVEEVAEELGQAPVSVSRTGNRLVMRIDAPDGAVVMPCRRDEQGVTLAKDMSLLGPD
jgi:hypothetical protein